MNRMDRIRDVAKRHVDAGALSGVEWCMLRGGTVWTKGSYGLADGLNGTPLPEQPIYRIFSMTKPVVSAVALMLVEQGRLRLFDPLSAYLPEFTDMQVLQMDGNTVPAGLITIEQLLTHRAGLSYGFLANCPVAPLYRAANLRDTDLSLADFCIRVAALPLAYQPGREWRYSVATDVLARVLEVVLEQKLPDILQDYLLGPIGTKDTGFRVDKTRESRLLPMFGRSNLDDIMEFDAATQRLIPADMSADQPHDKPGFYRGGTGLFSTLADYVLIARFLQSGKTADGTRLLSQKMIEMMWRDRIPVSQKPLKIDEFAFGGYGWGLAGRVMSDLGQAQFLTEQGECGWGGAASTFFWIDPKNDLIGVVMTQYLGSKIPIGEDFQTAVYQAL